MQSRQNDNMKDFGVQEPEQVIRDRRQKDEQRFNQFVKWAKKYRKKAERFNNKTKKEVNEQDKKICFQLKKRKEEQETLNKNTVNPSQNADVSRKGSLLDFNIKRLDQTPIIQSQKQSQLNSPITISQQSYSYKFQNDTLLLDNQSQTQEQNNTNLEEKKQQLQKKKEEEDNELRLLIRREMMVDDSIAGQLSYKLMLKMEQFFDRHQLKNTKSKEKIIKYLQNEKDESELQKPTLEQEEPYNDDNDFIRRDSFWSSLFAKSNDVYQLRIPEQFQKLNQNDLLFPKDQPFVDLNMSETIQSKINSIRVIRFKDRIHGARERIKQREETEQKMKMDKLREQKEQEENELLLLQLEEKNRLMKEKMNEFDYSDDNNQQKHPNSNLTQAYSISQRRKSKEQRNSLFAIDSKNLQTTGTTLQNGSKSQIGVTNSTAVEGSVQLKKRGHCLDLEEIELDSINSMKELQQKRGAINRLYEKLFPSQQNQTKDHLQNRQSFFKEESNIKNTQGQKDKDKFISQMSPQKSPTKSSVSSQFQRQKSQQLSRKSSFSQSQSQSELINQSSSGIFNQNKKNSPLPSSRKESQSMINQFRHKNKKISHILPAKLQKQYQTYYQLSNVPYMSEVGMTHIEQKQLYASILEDYCMNPFENINQLNEIIEDHEEQMHPELVKKKIYKDHKPKKPRFEMKKYDEIEFLSKKVDFQYRDRDKIYKFNDVDDNQDQIISHNINKRVKSFSSLFIKRPQINFYKEKSENLTELTKNELSKTVNIQKDLQKFRINENKKSNNQVRKMKNFSQKYFVYTPQEQKQIQYQFPPYPLKQQDGNNKQKNIQIKKIGSRVQTAQINRQPNQ